MDQTLQGESAPVVVPAPALPLLDFNTWIGYQLDKWVEWVEQHGEDWLTWPTQNERWPTIGTLFVHAFSPLHRYADQVAGVDPADDSHLHADSWLAVLTWARLCLERHREVCAGLDPGDAARLVVFKTRTDGDINATIGECMTHACTHCFWHLGGIAHLLRLGGLEPPQHSDLIFWAAERHELLASLSPAEPE